MGAGPRECRGRDGGGGQGKEKEKGWKEEKEEAGLERRSGTPFLLLFLPFSTAPQSTTSVPHAWLWGFQVPPVYSGRPILAISQLRHLYATFS